MGNPTGPPSSYPEGAEVQGLLLGMCGSFCQETPEENRQTDPSGSLPTASGWVLLFPISPSTGAGAKGSLSMLCSPPSCWAQDTNRAVLAPAPSGNPTWRPPSGWTWPKPWLLFFPCPPHPSLLRAAQATFLGATTFDVCPTSPTAKPAAVPQILLSK